MSASSIALLLIILAIIAGGLYYLVTASPAPVTGLSSTTTSTLPGAPNTGNSSGAAGTATNSTSTNTSPSIAFSAPLLKVATNTSEGPFLESSDGKALYIMTGSASSTCTAAACNPWTPYTVQTSSSVSSSASGSNNSGNLSGTSGLPGMVGLINMPDGRTQVTYNGAPLYLYANDTANTTRGANVSSYWQLARP